MQIDQQKTFYIEVKEFWKFSYALYM